MSASNTRLSATTTMPSADVCFFFQAEDGIRDVAVTGVQTCALPISEGRDVPHGRVCDRAAAGGGGGAAPGQLRSEERRVGKECRTRWWLVHAEKEANTAADTIARSPAGLQWAVVRDKHMCGRCQEIH